MYKIYVPINPLSIIFKDYKYRFSYDSNFIQQHFKLYDNSLYAIEWVSYFKATINLDNVDDFKNYQKIIVFDNDKGEYYCFNVMTIIFNNANKTNITLDLELDGWFELTKLNDWSINTQINYSTIKDLTLDDNNNYNSLTLTTTEGLNHIKNKYDIEFQHESSDGYVCFKGITLNNYKYVNSRTLIYQNIRNDYQTGNYLKPTAGLMGLLNGVISHNTTDSFTCEFMSFNYLYKLNTEWVNQYAGLYSNIINSENIIKVVFPFTKYPFAGCGLLFESESSSLFFETCIFPNRNTKLDMFSMILSQHSNLNTDYGENNEIWAFPRFNSRYYIKVKMGIETFVNKSENELNDILNNSKLYDGDDVDNSELDHIKDYRYYLYPQKSVAYQSALNSNLFGATWTDIKPSTIVDGMGLFPTLYSVNFGNRGKIKYWNLKLYLSSEFNTLKMFSPNSNFELNGWELYFSDNSVLNFNIYEYTSLEPTTHLRINFVKNKTEINSPLYVDISNAGVVKTNAWIDYLYSNSSQYQVAKSYADSNLQLTKQQNKLGLASSIVGAISGVASSVISGGIYDSLIGSSGGAIIGGATSAVKGGLDIASTILSNKKSLLSAENAVNNLNAIQQDKQRSYNLNYQNVNYSNVLECKNIYGNKVYSVIESVCKEQTKLFEQHFFIYGLKINQIYTLSQSSFSRDFDYIECENNRYENVPVILQDYLNENLKNGLWIFNKKGLFNSTTSMFTLNGWSE